MPSMVRISGSSSAMRITGFLVDIATTLAGWVKPVKPRMSDWPGVRPSDSKHLRFGIGLALNQQVNWLGGYRASNHPHRAPDPDPHARAWRDRHRLRRRHHRAARHDDGQAPGYGQGRHGTRRLIVVDFA